MESIRVLLIGDVVGAAGCAMVQKHLSKIKQAHNIDAIILNGENCSRGKGITPKNVRFFRHNGVDIVTSGNHIWRHKDIYSYLNEHNDLLRPANFPSAAPGVGVSTFLVGQHRVAVINIQGRVFMRELADCPFRTVDSILTYLQDKTSLVFVDFHAEATSEKMAMAFFLDGRVSGVVGTHTHVQTADERILPGGTGYITDLGMTGSFNSMLGMKKEGIIETFLTTLPTRFSPDASHPLVISGVWMEVDTATGKTTKIERVMILDNELHVHGTEDE